TCTPSSTSTTARKPDSPPSTSASADLCGSGPAFRGRAHTIRVRIRRCARCMPTYYRTGYFLASARDGATSRKIWCSRPSYTPSRTPDRNGVLVPLPRVVGVADDIDDRAVRCAHEEPPHSPRLRRQRIHDLEPPTLRFLVGRLH